MKLRPHHLLCTQGYSGKGYSEAFVNNMNEKVGILRGSAPAEIEIVFGVDDLCKCCPHQTNRSTCVTQEKVQTIDSKIVKYFGLEEGNYIYQDLIREINKQMTEDKMEDICGQCNWYPISACKNKILKKVKEVT